VKYAHRKCGEVVAEYSGPVPPVEMRAKDWVILGKQPESYSVVTWYRCPNCGERFDIGARDLREDEPSLKTKIFVGLA
jgi:hypothetical protein